MKRFFRFFSALENVIMLILLFSLILLSFLQVGGRLFFNTGLPDGDTIIYHLVLWAGLWGAILATRQKEHITIDLVSRFVSGRLLCFIQSITNLFASVVCAILTVTAIRFIQDEISMTQGDVIGIPLWILQLIIPYAFGIMSVRFYIFSLQDLIRAVRPLSAKAIPT